MRSAIPSATYRLQLNRDFPFDAAARRVDYFARLGISHLYLSPVLAARPGSMHGYDVIDHGRINPELGGEAGLLRLAQRAHAEGLGLILDIVPNHMAVWRADNPLWLDVLENGRASPYADMFDIDFDADAELQGKILAPVLGEPYGDALAHDKIALIWDADLGKLAFAYGPHRFPLRPADYASVAGGVEPRNADLSPWRDASRLHHLLERQTYRLAWWRSAGDRLNWRRFFDVNELAGLRVEREPVFGRVHAVVLRLYAEGVIDGVRVDHIDGLADPARYARTLRQRLAELNRRRPSDAPRDGPYIVVEKILGPREPFPADWGVHGTSGYDFMNEVSALLHDAAGAPALDALWRRFGCRTADFDLEETTAREEILETSFAGQLEACARVFEALASGDWASRDLTAAGFRRALRAMIARLRVYRSYADGRGAPTGQPVQAALDAAVSARPADRPALAFIGQILAGRGPGEPTDRVEAARRLNQLTAPVAAKAVEDTALYRYGRLLSRNDVGSDPGVLGTGAQAFIASGAARASDWPHAMLATATHDHKRGEDVRARLAVLSEAPDLWAAALEDWLALAASTRPGQIADDDAYTLFQTLVGVWPIGLAPSDRSGLSALAGRVAGWRRKSLREAKLRSSWAAPNLDYEEASRAWVEALLDPGRSHAFLDSLAAFVGRIAGAGAIYGVTQAALRCVWPGVPDLYQGAELWDLSLVDPDNRRPVDYDLRERLLAAGAEDWASGAVKQAAIARLLALRRRAPELFAHGLVEPIPVRGARAGHVLAIRRRLGSRSLELLAMLHVAGAVSRLGELPAPDWWGDTDVLLDDGWAPVIRLVGDQPVFVEAHGV